MVIISPSTISGFPYEEHKMCLSVRLNHCVNCCAKCCSKCYPIPVLFIEIKVILKVFFCPPLTCQLPKGSICSELNYDQRQHLLKRYSKQGSTLPTAHHKQENLKTSL